MDADRDAEIARCLFRESNDALFLFDPDDDRILDLNPAARRLTGLAKKTAQALRIGDLIESHDSDALKRLATACHETTFFHSREEYSLKRSAGEPIPVNLSVSRIHTTPRPMGLLVARDISERRRASEALERFFHVSPDLFCILDDDVRFRRVNPAWTECLGFPPEELLTMSPLDLVHPEDLPATNRASAALLRGELSGFENRLRRKDGSYRCLSWNVAVVEGRAFAVARDITELKRAQALRREKEAAEAASRAKGHFLARISHELRTPMSVILGLVDVFLLAEDLPPLPPERLEDLHAIRRNGEHLLRIIDDILDLSRIDAGKLDIAASPFDPRGVIADVVAMLTSRAAAKGLILQAEYQGELPAKVHNDPARLRQILITLVGNAIKFTDEGSVRLAVGMEEDPGDPEAALLRFDVMDTGIGMTAEAVADLFQPFHQVDSGHDRSRGGTGLGLAISRRLATMLGGSIAVESESGWGSTFSLTVAVALKGGVPANGKPAAPPKAEESESPSAPGPSATSCPRPSRRILLAEDNPDNLRAVTLRLRQAGLDVLGVPDGQQAKDTALAAHASGRPFDVILMDMQMPVLDGFEATRLLRSEGYDRPIIALTAYAMPEDREECLRFGCDEHVSKPIDWTRLLGLIEGKPR